MNESERLTAEHGKCTPTGAAEARALVEQLADREWFTAFQALEELGPAAIAAVREGLGDGRWQVRRWCAAFLDHNGGPA